MKDRKEQLLRQYTARVKKEGILKSVLIGCCAGAAALVTVGLLSWLLGFKAGLFVALAAFVAVTAAVSVLLYFLKFKPTVKQVARRVDELGLEERLITMVELEGDDSVMAELQRRDTEKALSSMSSMLIKIALSTALLVAVAIVGVLGVGVTTVDALYYADVIPSGVDVGKKEPEIRTFTLKYEVEKGEGTIYRVEDNNFELMDPLEETVQEGEDGSTVYAYAARGWVFVDWSDGYTLPYRKLTSVDSDRTLKARFEEMEDIDDREPERPQDGNSGSGENSEDGDSQEEGDGQPSDGSQGDQEQQQTPSGPGDKNQGDGANGLRDEDRNQVLDGKTYYGDQYDGAYEDAMDRTGSDGNLSDPRKDAISDYLDSIEKNGGGSSGDAGGDAEDGN